MGVNSSLDKHSLTLDEHRLRNRSFLLGNRSGFSVYLPVSPNLRDRTVLPIKWYGGNGFGRKFLETASIDVEYDGELVRLDRSRQTAFAMDLDSATRVFEVGAREVRCTFFVPNDWQALVLTLDGPFSFQITPQFDMRYYQAFNTDFASYQASVTADELYVSNRVRDVGESKTTMDFFARVILLGKGGLNPFPEDRRLVTKTYLKDEHRDKLVHREYAETGSQTPDHAPLWDQYETQVYVPALIRSDGACTLVFAFGDTTEEVEACRSDLATNLPDRGRAKRELIQGQLQSGQFETGDVEVDRAYAHVLTRFNDALVARDAVLHVDPVHRDHFYGIFAGNKYFMDAWKRDENISLGGLLATNDFETVRAILDNTWQHQDERTGRLPQILRAGEKLVYYSSDGTLWALQRLFEYTRMSGDESLLAEKLPMIMHFFAASMNFVQRGLLPSGGIVDKTYLWETWEDTPFTPRDGYPVEIQMLWLNALLHFLPWIEKANPALADQMGDALQTGRETFKRFALDGYLADGLDYDWKPRSELTPNGYMAFGLDYELPASLARAMVHLARDELGGERGIRSLAPRDWPAVFPVPFLDDPRNRHGNNLASVGIYDYHRGIEWEWLNPFFVRGELRYGDPNLAYRFYVEALVKQALHEGGVGGLSELYDLHGVIGADFQAWSMAGFLESLRLFSGVQVNALSHTVHVAPRLPDAWPRIKSRHRVAERRFDLLYERTQSGSHHLVLVAVDSAPPACDLTVSLRFPEGWNVVSTTLNGVEVEVDRWREEPFNTGCSRCLTLPFDAHVDIRLESAPG